MADGDAPDPGTRRKHQDGQDRAYHLDTLALDNLFGSLEVALEHSDRQLEQERAIADERAANPNPNPLTIECEHCFEVFPLSKWFIETHTPRCEQEQCGGADVLPEMECPQCRETMERNALLAHLYGAGPSECREYWRTLSVVEKKAAHPDFDLDQYASRLLTIQTQGHRDVLDASAQNHEADENMTDVHLSAPLSNGDTSTRGIGVSTSVLPSASSSTLPVRTKENVSDFPELLFPFEGHSRYPTDDLKRKRSAWKTTVYCPNCGTSVHKQTWFFTQHLQPCIARAMAAGTLGMFNPWTGKHVQAHEVVAELGESQVNSAQSQDDQDDESPLEHTTERKRI